MTPLEQPADFKQRCEEDAFDIVNRVKSIQVQRLRNMKNMDLITKLISLQVQIRTLSEQDTSSPDCSSILDSLRELKSTLNPSNLGLVIFYPKFTTEMVVSNSTVFASPILCFSTFDDLIDVKIQHVMSGLNTQGNLHSFLYMHPNHMQYI